MTWQAIVTAGLLMQIGGSVVIIVFGGLLIIDRLRDKR